MQKGFCSLYIEHQRDAKYSLIISNNHATYYNVSIDWVGSAHAHCAKAFSFLLSVEDRTHRKNVYLSSASEGDVIKDFRMTSKEEGYVHIKILFKCTQRNINMLYYKLKVL